MSGLSARLLLEHKLGRAAQLAYATLDTNIELEAVRVFAGVDDGEICRHSDAGDHGIAEVGIGLQILDRLEHSTANNGLPAIFELQMNEWIRLCARAVVANLSSNSQVAETGFGRDPIENLILVEIPLRHELCTEQAVGALHKRPDEVLAGEWRAKMVNDLEYEHEGQGGGANGPEA